MVIEAARNFVALSKPALLREIRLWTDAIGEPGPALTELLDRIEEQRVSHETTARLLRLAYERVALTAARVNVDAFLKSEAVRRARSLKLARSPRREHRREVDPWGGPDAGALRVDFADRAAYRDAAE
jgi:hypothetical protein